MTEEIFQVGSGDEPRNVRLLYGVRVEEGLRRLDAASVDCVVTSPPYYQLRDYGTPHQQWTDGWVGELGQEPTPDLFVTHLVDIFREVRRVLRPDGTLWLNLGDTYDDGKSLLGIPWRVANAFTQDGWLLRNAIVVRKTNHMPHPVKDRFTTAYEMLFLFAATPRYHFDLDAVRVPHTCGTYDEDGSFRPRQRWLESGSGNRKMDQTGGHLGVHAGPTRRVGRGLFNPKGKSPGDVWDVPTAMWSGAHFAVMPPEMAIRSIKAGSKPGGTVLDPFSGSGTTGMHAVELRRHYIGVDLNADYLPMARERIEGHRPVPPTEDDSDAGVLDLFGVR